MAETVKPIPGGFHTLTPYLVVRGASQAIDYKRAFGAEVRSVSHELVDPFGHQRSLATHKEDLTPEEIKKGGEAFFAETAKQKQQKQQGKS